MATLIVRFYEGKSRRGQSKCTCAIILVTSRGQKSEGGTGEIFQMVFNGLACIDLHWFSMGCNGGHGSAFAKPFSFGLQMW